MGCQRPCSRRWQRPLDCARPVKGLVFEPGNACNLWIIPETGRTEIWNRRRRPVVVRVVVRVVRQRVVRRQSVVQRRPHPPQTLNNFSVALFRASHFNILFSAFALFFPSSRRY